MLKASMASTGKIAWAEEVYNEKLAFTAWKICGANISLLTVSRYVFAHAQFRNIWIRMFFRFRYFYVAAIYFILRFE